MNIDDYLRKSLGGTTVKKASATPYTGNVVGLYVCDLPSASVTFENNGVSFTEDLPTGFIPLYAKNVTSTGNVLMYTA
jgi:hypothetical protein